MSQLISETTRVAVTTASLLDHFSANKPDRTSDSGVIHTGIGDHSMIFVIREINYTEKRKEKIIEFRNMKKLNGQNFLEDLLNNPWEYVYLFAEDTNSMWNIWKDLFFEVLNKHASLQSKKIKPKRNPRVTSTLKMLMTARDKLKRKAIITNLETDWLNYKKVRNKANLELRKAKKEYYSHKIAGQKFNPKDPRKTINTLLGRKNTTTSLNELSINGINLSNPQEIAKGFINYYLNIGIKLADMKGT